MITSYTFTGVQHGHYLVELWLFVRNGTALPPSDTANVSIATADGKFRLSGEGDARHSRVALITNNPIIIASHRDCIMYNIIASIRQQYYN